MDLYEKDPTVTKAMALALLRQSSDLLGAIGEAESARHVEQAIEALRRGSRTEPAPAAEAS